MRNKDSFNTAGKGQQFMDFVPFFSWKENNIITTKNKLVALAATQVVLYRAVTIALPIPQYHSNDRFSAK